VRDYLRRVGREGDWTELQGYVYGPRIVDAEMYPGVREFFQECRARKLDLSIVSHQTRHPFRGPQYDLHASAREWLTKNGFYDQSSFGLPSEHVHFELTKQAKLDRIAQEGCTSFVDDLPEFLEEPGFPPAVERVLFDPNAYHSASPAYRRAVGWAEIAALFR